MIREMFPDVELLNSAPPDEVIAVGAALEAGLLVGRDGLTPEEDSVTVDVSSIDVLVKVRRCCTSFTCMYMNVNVSALQSLCALLMYLYIISFINTVIDF